MTDFVLIPNRESVAHFELLLFGWFQLVHLDTVNYLTRENSSKILIHYVITYLNFLKDERFNVKTYLFLF